MASIWEAVLASSAVSAVISAVIASGSRLWTERQQRNTVAHQLARSLEGYGMQCANEIVDADVASLMKSKYQEDGYLDKQGLPEIQFQTTDLDRLKPDWRDRISTFPSQVEVEKRYLSTVLDDVDDAYEWKIIKQCSKAKLGKAAFTLATQIREEHKLPTKHTAAASKSALAIFKSVFDSHERFVKHQEESNVHLNAQLFKVQTSLD